MCQECAASSNLVAGVGAGLIAQWVTRPHRMPPGGATMPMCGPDLKIWRHIACWEVSGGWPWGWVLRGASQLRDLVTIELSLGGWIGVRRSLGSEGQGRLGEVSTFWDSDSRLGRAERVRQVDGSATMKTHEQANIETKHTTAHCWHVNICCVVVLFSNACSSCLHDGLSFVRTQAFSLRPLLVMLH